MSYPLDLASPVRHVATEMERAAPRALSISELAATYAHPNWSDVIRVRRAESLQTDQEALAWIIERALDQIKRYVDNGDGAYRLKVPLEKVKFKGRVVRRVEPRGRFEDAFDPMRGEFSVNIRDQSVARANPGGADDELRESLLDHGWEPLHPAIRDERGVLLTGHRRVAIAKELGIEPVYQDVELGSGDAADQRRFTVALTANRGNKPMNNTDLKRLSMYLYGEEEWSREKIVAALHEPERPAASPTAKPRPRGDGRPKTKLTKAQQARVQEMADAGVTYKEIAKTLGVGEHQVQLLQWYQQGYQQGKAEAGGGAQ